MTQDRIDTYLYKLPYFLNQHFLYLLLHNHCKEYYVKFLPFPLPNKFYTKGQFMEFSN